ncbi:nuclear transport factor 2 family protein [Sphingobium sp. AN641]|uniref:nuclear transport factor 2 family protein n=1 Tax=Sphingobium sp. AN641 TaxID=3133443 RepID=UPI0030C08128
MTVSAIVAADVVERERIRDCLARYCHAIDRRDADLLRSCYWPEAVDDHATFVGTVDAFVTYAMESLAAMVLTQHNLGQILIRLDGDTAVSQSLLTAYHRMDIGGEHRDITLGGRYLDRWEKRDDEWRIIHRVLVADWMKDFGASADWSNGLAGAPFVSDHAVGKAEGDFSETLFPRQNIRP